MRLIDIDIDRRSGQSKGERGVTAFPHRLFSAYVVPPPRFKCLALITC